LINTPRRRPAQGKPLFFSSGEKNLTSQLYKDVGTAQERGGDNGSSDYHEALCRLGAGLKRLALEKPEGVRSFMR
jgi:hypothetical protein